MDTGNETSATAAASEVESLRKALQMAQCAQRDLYFARLLGGGYFRTEEAALAEGESLDTAFPSKHFLLLSARPETWGALFTGGELNWRDSNFILRNTLENGLPGTVQAAEVQGNMLAILNLSSIPETGTRGIRQDAQRIAEVLDAEYGITVTIAISRFYQSILDLPAAMEDIHRIYDYLALLGEDSPITTYEELTHVHVQPSTVSFTDLEGRLIGCVRASDFAGADRVIHDLLQGEFGDAKPTVDTVRFRVYGLVNTLLYLLNDIRSAVGNEIVDRIDPGPRLTSAKSLEEIVSVMDDIFAQLEEYSSQKRSARPPSWLLEMKSYIEHNFRDPNLNLSTLADRFGISSTYCSKMFRDQYGIRLVDYIQQLRLEAAKKLLIGDKPLREIADETGFSTVLTFSRAIKHYEGTTANHLRESLRMQRKPEEKETLP